MDEIARLSEWHKTQVGTAETGNNNVIYNTHFYGGEVDGDFPWCCAYIWDSFRLNGLSHLFCDGEKTAYCPFVYEWAKSHKQLVYAPYREGDLILFDWNADGKPDHIGYCLIGGGDMITTIEGNAGDRVSKLVRFKSGIIGAYRPNYSARTEPEKKPDVYVVKPGDSLWKISNETGVSVAELIAFNNIENPNLIKVGKSLNLRGGDEVGKADSNIILSDDSGGVREDVSTYTVKPGDSLWRICIEFYGSGSQATIDRLKALNNLDSNLILPGKTLKLR